MQTDLEMFGDGWVKVSTITTYLCHSGAHVSGNFVEQQLHIIFDFKAGATASSSCSQTAC